MEIKRKYTDEPGADKGAIHLMINRRCGNSCPLCCNRQYDLETVPVATVEDLKAAHTVMLTGGDPFYVESLMDILAQLRYDYHNIEYVYIYTSGFPMLENVDILRYPEQFFSGVNGINFSPKSISDYAAIREMLSNPQYIFQRSAYLRNNRIILMPNDFMTRKQQEEYIKSLPLEGLAFYGAKFDVEYREWQEEFQPNGGVWRRLPVFL